MKYDIFISYKHKDFNENETPDYKIANELYTRLINLGYSTFFSDKSLEEIGSSNYSDDIDDALDSANILIVVLTQEMYAESKWVKYEWKGFNNDILRDKKPYGRIFTLYENINMDNLPRALRDSTGFNLNDGYEHVLESIKNAMREISLRQNREVIKNNIEIIKGRDVTKKDIIEALELDHLTYDNIYWINVDDCIEWWKINPNIYIMAKDLEKDKIIGYVNISPVTDECYEKIKNGDFIDTQINSDMILNYDMPFPYSLYFSSIVIHPQYQNTDVFFKILNQIINQFIDMGKREVYIKRMIADAVSPYGEKFCKMFGMKKIKNSDHNSNLYEVSMLPPEFRPLSSKAKELYDYYKAEYEKNSFLF